VFKKNTEKMGSFLGGQSEFHGELKVVGTLRMDGEVTGTVQADQVILTDAATIKGDVLARKIVVGGKVEGNIRAAEIVEIRSKGKVRGNIFTDNLLVIEGGEFNGKIEMRTGESKGPDFDSRGQELDLKPQ